MSAAGPDPARAREFHRLYRTLRIDDQLGYYRRRRTEYRKAHRQAVVVRNVLLLVAAVAAPVGQLFADDLRVWLAVLAAVAAGFATAVTGYEALIDFTRLESLYGDTAHNLARASVDWERLDPEADPEAQVERVESILRTENGQWGQLAVAPVAGPDETGVAEAGREDAAT